jgi:polar amino acid transport system permease protein
VQSLDFSVVAPYTGLLLTGLWWTVALTVVSCVLSLIFGLAFALIVLYGPMLFALPVRFLMWLFMGTPLLLQLYLIYYGLVQVGIDVPAFLAGAIGLSLHFAVYNADIIRAGILAVDPGQNEGARSIGFSNSQSLRYVVIPQGIRNTLPALGNMLIVLLKDTSTVSIIGIAELVHSAQLAISETYTPFEFYITVAAIYYVANLFMEVALRRVEKAIEATR